MRKHIIGSSVVRILQALAVYSPLMFRRIKVTIGMLLIAGALGVAGYMLYSKDIEWLRYLSVACYTLCAAIMAMGFGVLLWGRIKITGILSIDVTQNPPEFRLGPMFFNVAIGSKWRSGAVRIRPVGLYLVVPWTVRIAVVIALSLLIFRSAKQLMPEDPNLTFVIGGVSVVILYLIQSRIKSPSPEKLKAIKGKSK
jgi:hypothetical protein